MKKIYLIILLVLISTIFTNCKQLSSKKTIVTDKVSIADKPLFRDPIFDGAADPVVLWNKKEQKWFMFYTNRRAKKDSLPGVSWVHGTKIGIAESNDGASWRYKTTCNIDYEIPDVTHWAPEVIEHEGTYHMYLTIVPGVFEGWYHPRYIVHLTSDNMVDWKYQSTLSLASERCIDASVFQLPNGTWRMYYNNENDRKSMYYADSKDLYTWVDSGKKVTESRGEGPKVFRWKDKNWMVIDTWKGIGVFSSDDFVTWNKQKENILRIPGTGLDDKVKGGHADVVVQGEKAYIFYFTHPGRIPENEGVDSFETRRSSIQVAELEYVNGEIVCNRNKDVKIQLVN